MSAFLVDLPAINAIFNGVTAVCLLAGFLAIKAGHRHGRHRALDACRAFACGAVCLAGYLVHTFDERQHPLQRGTAPGGESTWGFSSATCCWRLSSCR